MNRLANTIVFTLLCAGVAPASFAVDNERAKDYCNPPGDPGKAQIEGWDENGLKGDDCHVDISFSDREIHEFGYNKNCHNDFIRSVGFWHIRAGTEIIFYDDPDCEKDDDWTSFKFIQTVKYTYAWGLESSLDDDDCASSGLVLIKTYHKDNGLDGKVSCMEVFPPGYRSA